MKIVDETKCKWVFLGIATAGDGRLQMEASGMQMEALGDGNGPYAVIPFFLRNCKFQQDAEGLEEILI